MTPESEKLLTVLCHDTATTGEALSLLGTDMLALAVPKPSRAATDERPFTLWYRPHRRTGWQAVATGKTRGEAVAQIGCGGRRNGEWYVGGAFEPKPPSSRQGFADAAQEARP